MNELAKSAAVLFAGILGGVCLHAQTADIGKITLSGPNFGYQTVGVYNLTGATQGCEQYQTQYNVCNGLNIATWQLTVTFTANASGLAPSPLVFTSNGAPDQIPPTGSSFTAYTGEAANPWSLSFSLQNAGCSPSCDATISSITFSGTLDTTSLNLYNTSASGPFILDSLPSPAFSVTWNIPTTDYTATPGSLFDSTDILITNQPQLTSQTITFGPLSDLLLTATPPALSASATSTLAVSFNSNNNSVCMVSGTAVNLVSAGLCSITASQLGNSTYAAAAPVTQTFNVTQAPQTITFGPLSDLAITVTPPALSAAATSSQPVVFTSNTTPVCTVAGTAITLISGGTCSITASQAGTTIYAPAPTVTQTFQVTLTPQAITFAPIANQLLTAGGSLGLTASASSNLVVSYTSNSLGICTVTNSTVAFLTTGTCSITANQAGNGTVYGAATPVTQTFNIQSTQAITFGPISNLALTATPPALSATASSGLTVSFASTTPLVCTVSVTTVSLVAGGTCSITATQAGDATHAAAAPVTQSFTVLGSQTITFGPISNIGLTETPPALSATASSGLVVSFASNTSLVCTVSGTAVTLVKIGTCSITASQAGDAAHAAAPTVTQTFQILTSQTITFGPISNLAITATPPALSATASSNLTVSFASTTAPVCTVAGTTVTLVTTGVCSITASQAGDGSTYAPATSVVQTFNVQSNQTITFGPISSIGLNVTPPALSATASSSLAVGFASNSTSVCTVSGTTVALVTTGTCSITASQPGDATHAPAPAVTQTFTVQSAQTITFNSPGAQNLGTSPTLTASATSGLTVTFTSNSLPVCTVAVNTNTVTLLTTGTCSITANQAGDPTHAAAPPVTQTFAVNLEPQTITFNAIASQPLGTPVTVSATASSTLGVTFTSNSLPICTLSNINTVTLVTTGTCSITAAQTGNSTFAAAPTVTQTFTVTLEPQTVTFGPINTILLSAPPPPLSATASSTLGVTFSSNNTSVCTVSGTAVTLVATGTCSITASQAGNSTYAAASATQTFLVTTLTPQSITFNPIPAQTIGVAPPSLSATATSTLAVTLTSNSNPICTVSNTTITLVSIGTCSITASQGGGQANSTTYAAATPITQTFAVNGTPQTITFNSPGAQNLGTSPTLTANATSGLGVTFTSNSLSVCSVSNSTITLVSAGTCSITAAQTGSSIYAAAPTVTQTFAVNPAPQTITFGPISTILLTATPPALSATATSGLAVSFASNSSSVCTVQVTTLTLVSAGTCSITASQPGGGIYAAATPVTQMFVVTTLTPQSITFGPIAAQTIGVAPPALSASATSSLAITFTSNSNPVCTVSNTAITLVSIGTCSITASQGGGQANSTTYAAATPITQTFAVNGTPQTITFNSPGAQNLGTSPTLTANATSGLGVTFTSNSLSVCSVSNSTLTLVSAGTCSITAAQTGSSIYAAAPTVTQTFAVSLAPQTITFGPISSILLTTAPPALSATATSGLAVSFASNSSSVCTVAGTSVTLVSGGTCSITASQPGGGIYAAATPVVQTFVVTTLGQQSITFSPLSSQAFGTTPPALSATATSGLAVTFVSNSNAVCTVAGTTITLVSVGTCSITANQPGDNTVNAAAPVTQIFNVTQGANVITFNAPGTQTLGQSPFGLTATASSGLAVTFASTTTSVCTVSSATLTLVATGTCAITASQAGNGNYAAATPVARSFTVNAPSTPAKYFVAPTSLTFNYQLGDAATPPSQSVSVFSAPVGAGYTVGASSSGGSGNWLTATAASSSPTTPSAVSVSVSTSGFTQPGQFSGQVAINTGGASTLNVPVTFNITAAQAPALALAPAQETFSISQNSSSVSGQVTVSNAGGGTLTFTASATSDSGWLSVNGSGSGSATLASPATVAFTINPQGLKPGVYSGRISVSGASTTRSTTIILGITSPLPQIQLSRTGVSLTGVSNGSVPGSEVVNVSNSGGGTLQWSASVSTLSGGNWLTVTPNTGTSQAGTTGSNVSILANPANLTPGTYSGSVNFKAQGAVNSPQTVSVTFTVSAATHQFPVFVVPAATIVIGTAGQKTPVNTNMFLIDLNANPLAYSASTSASWLSVGPASGSVPSTTSLQISVDFSKLSGLNVGSVSVGFGDGSGATVTVVAFALGSLGTGNDVAGPRPNASVSACPGGKPSFLIPVFQQPSAGASLQASYPADVTVQIIDDCGKAVTAAAGGSVQVTFSNGDPGISLVDTGSGIWEGTWTPATAASQVTLQIAASENGVTLNSASGIPSSETVSVTAAAEGAPPQPTGVANAASAGQAIPSVVAPGSYIAIYGTNLAGAGNPNATAGQPLPTTLNGVQLTLGGLPLPLLYASPTQVNAVIPQGIAPNSTYPLVVVNGTTQSVPVALTVAELQPGTYTVDTSGSGAGIVADALTGQLITASNPAHAGQNLVIYMTGLGALTGTNGEQEPADGAIAPLTTLYHTTSKVSVTIGGVAVPTQFAGLTPTLTALYQVNVQMPSGVTPGSAVPIVVTATDPATGATATSNATAIAVQ